MSLSGHPDPISIEDRDRLAERFAALAVKAGAIVMRHYRGHVEVREKPDHSPVTAADEDTEAFLLPRLQESCPGVPILAEESAARGLVPRCGEHFLLVDPLDGTKEFLHRNGEFTVNIACIDGGAPVAGAVFAPAMGRLWYAGRRAFTCSVEAGGVLPPPAARREIHCRPAPPQALVALESRSHANPKLDAFLAKLPVGERRKAGSSLKFCLIAEGLADLYPRFGPTMEWDTAAGDAVLRAAGGRVCDASGRVLQYGKQLQGFHNPDFIAAGPGAPSTIR